jgi:hypothetical protein
VGCSSETQHSSRVSLAFLGFIRCRSRSLVLAQAGGVEVLESHDGSSSLETPPILKEQTRILFFCSSSLKKELFRDFGQSDNLSFVFG